MTPPAASLDTRARLIDAARYLFWEKGYAATGLADILGRAQANSGSFYHFFESKDALLRTVLETYVEMLKPHLLAPVRAKARTPLDEVFGLLESYRARLIDTDCTYGCPIGRLALEIDPENTPAHALIARNFDGWTAEVAGALRRANVRAPDDVAVFVLTVMEGAVMQARAHRSVDLFDTCIRQLRMHIKALTRASAPRTSVRRTPRRSTRSMIPALIVLVSLLVTQTSPVSTQKLSSPEKALRFEVVVPGSLDDVWNAFSTKAGMETWLWKEARVEMRPGGDWLVIFSPTATAGGTVVSVVPKAQVVIKAMAPEEFPTVRSERTTATFGFESIGPKATRVTLTQTGWKAGAEWDAAYEYLAKGNAQLLTQLHQRFASGPIDWSKSK